MEIAESEMPVAIIRLECEHEVLSSAVLNGGHCVTDTLMIMEVPKMYDCSDPIAHIMRIRYELGLPENTVGFMTAAEVSDVATLTRTEYNGTITHSIATAGLSNIITAGDVITDMDERLERSRKKRSKVGTINIIGIVPFPLSDEGRVNAFIVMTEAKTAALNSLGYNETGTTSDAIAIVSPIDGDVVKYTGTGTDVGISLARSVRDSVRSALVKRSDFKEMGTFLDQLAIAGVSRQSIKDAAFELYIPNPEWDTDVLKTMFDQKLEIYVKDINVSSLIQAAIELDRLGDKDCICAMPRGMFATDPIHLIADEMLGMQLAQYIAGTRGVFEFHRFDRHKPGIIAELGPFKDDIICGLAGGIMSSIYSELFEVVK